MTTTNIAGIEIDNDAIIVAEECADTLDQLIPKLFALLDRATASMSEIELAAMRQTGWRRTDEQVEATHNQTAFQRLEDHFYALNTRTDDTLILSAAFHTEDPARV